MVTHLPEFYETVTVVRVMKDDGLWEVALSYFNGIEQEVFMTFSPDAAALAGLDHKIIGSVPWALLDSYLKLWKEQTNAEADHRDHCQ